MPYVVQSLLLLLAPSLFSASIYMILGRIIRLLKGERHSVIRRTWLTKIFVTGDVLSFFIQSGGMLTCFFFFLLILSLSPPFLLYPLQCQRINTA